MRKKGHATEAKGWDFFELLRRRIGFVLIGIMTLASGIGVGGSSFGAEVVFVNAPRESWPQEKLTFGTDLTFRYETLYNFNCTGYGKDVPAGKEDDFGSFTTLLKTVKRWWSAKRAVWVQDISPIQ